MPTPRATDLKLSGTAYVPMRLKTDPESTPPTPVKILTVNNCQHETTVCHECIDSWAEDWIIFFNRTAGGRKLRGGYQMQERDIAYQLLGILQHYAPTSREQEICTKIYNDAQRHGATHPELIKMLGYALVDGLAHGNWPWTEAP